jgi:hypothetical protein
MKKIIVSEDVFIVRYLKASFYQIILVIALMIFVIIIDLPLIGTLLSIVPLLLIVCFSIKNYRRYLYAINFDDDYVSFFVKRFNKLETEIKVHISSINVEHTSRPFIQFNNDLLIVFINDNVFIKQCVVSGWNSDKFEEICSIIKTKKSNLQNTSVSFKTNE